MAWMPVVHAGLMSGGSVAINDCAPAGRAHETTRQATSARTSMGRSYHTEPWCPASGGPREGPSDGGHYLSVPRDRRALDAGFEGPGLPLDRDHCAVAVAVRVVIL